MTRADVTSPNFIARVAGVGYLVVIAAGIFAEFFVRSQLIVPGEAAATAANIAASQSFFRLGIASDLIMLTCDVLLAWALYVLLKPVSRNLSLLAAFFRLVHAAVYGVNLLNLILVGVLGSGAGYLSTLGSGGLEAQVMLFLDDHKYGYAIGLVFCEFHCLVLGYLLFRSRLVPKLLGILILIASLGYLVDSFANVLLTNYADYADIFILIVFLPAFVAELSLALWLLIKGVKAPTAEVG